MQPAPKARNMIAQGKREARRPGSSYPKQRFRPEGPEYTSPYYALSGLEPFFPRDPGATCSASLRTCPWLSYQAPSALLERELFLLSLFAFSLIRNQQVTA